jgi:uncharacterized hydrophobic protein (TIGR00271 family)
MQDPLHAPGARSIRRVVHLRVVAPARLAEQAVEVLERSASVVSIAHVPGASVRPEGDVVLVDVTPEDASVVIEDLKRLGIEEQGTIGVTYLDSAISAAARRAERAAPGAPGDAVLWEQVTEVTSESSTLSGAYLAFMVIAGWLAAVGIFLDSPILIVGAMVVGPEFGPLAGVCVALVERRRRLAMRSGLALLAGFPIAIAAVIALVAVFRATGVTPDVFTERDHGLSATIAAPDFFSFFVAFCAGVAGMLSLTTAKSGALIGVLISVTTIPAAANVGVSVVYGEWDSARGSAVQLGVNLGALVLAGVLTLGLQRALYHRRRARHAAELTRSSPATTTRRSSSARATPRP